ncbi:hypothetical protein PPROV_000156100 [Pycnococcus provasolii]|uniref:tRNA/rRNA methyltransferase SpoU type domain-containing protein n=1 Tax=Pycnococcus provasolii TaxID=41880 RepID=A0A830H6G1_9CHLO|nr:hypothetical protein PPROV_000156100 [Pycnococcus provasolii]
MDETTTRAYILLHNVSKKHNVGTLTRIATAFNVTTIVLTGNAHYNVFGCQGASAYAKFVHKRTLEDAVRWLKEDCACEIVGVEIDESAVPLPDARHAWCGEQPNVRSRAFFMGNEGHGLSEREISLCDKLVYIPQYGVGSTASLNVAVAAGVVLSAFAEAAAFAQCNKQGAKFDVAERPRRTQTRGFAEDDEEREMRIQARRLAREKAAHGDDDDDIDNPPPSLDTLFSES